MSHHLHRRLRLGRTARPAARADLCFPIRCSRIGKEPGDHSAFLRCAYASDRVFDLDYPVVDPVCAKTLRRRVLHIISTSGESRVRRGRFALAGAV